MNHSVIVGVNDAAYWRDIDGDGVFDGVYAVNHLGRIDGTEDGGVLDDASATFIPFADHTNHPRQGNYWWNQYGVDTSADGRGSNAPEMGAGASESDRADINVITTGGVIMRGGGGMKTPHRLVMVEPTWVGLMINQFVLKEVF